jgi:uncharacterized protein (DUF58 family)
MTVHTDTVFVGDAGPSLPQAMQPVRRRTALSREGWYWLFAFLGLWVTGWVKGINLILLLAYLLFLLLVLNWWAARRALEGISARRNLRGPVFAGTPFVWEAEAAGAGRKALTGWELVDDGPGHDLHWFILNLGPGERLRLRHELALPRRGCYECRPLRAVSSYPFGLVRQHAEFGATDRLSVLPQLGTLNAGRLRRWLQHTARPDERARRARRRLGLEVEFHGLRTFRPGDSPRWIHWRTSARSGELMVREFDHGTHHDLLLIVEPFAAPGTAHPAALEAAVSLAATVCWSWTYDAGDRVVLAVAGSPPQVADGHGGQGQALELLEVLATVKGTTATDMAPLVKCLQAVPLPTGPAVLISSRPGDSRAAEELTRRLERPVAYLDATAPPSFYHPPTAEGKYQELRTKNL